MSPSDRSTDRVEHEETNRQVKPTPGANRGADGAHPQHDSHRRVGASGLRRLASQLSDRDREILVSVRELHYLRSIQIQSLYFADHASPSAASRATRRVMHRLHHHDLVHRLERQVGGVRAGSAGYVYGLSSLGHRLLGTTTRKRSREPSLNHLDHVLDTAQVVVNLTKHCRPLPSAAITAVEGEPSCWRSFVADHGGQGLLKPDLRLTISSGELELHWFVEMDRGSEHRPVIRRKLRTYIAAWKDGSETKRAGVFPRVLWIALDDERAEVLNGIVDTTTEAPPGMFEVTTLERSPAVLLGGSP